MADETETQPAVPIAPPSPGQVPFVYANVAGTRGGAFDLSVDFGYAVPAGENEPQQAPTWLVRVGMSWEHARALVGLLQK